MMLPIALRVLRMPSLRSVAHAKRFPTAIAACCGNRGFSAASARPVDRIIRFISDDGQEYLGEEPTEAGLPATVVTGDLLSGSIARTAELKVVRTLLAPLIPTDIFCIGLNYIAHYEEGAKKRGEPLPDKPPVWLSPSSSLQHPGQDIWMPTLQHGETLDWENELTIVIGKTCRNVKKANALEYVLGYMVGIDVSCRHWQRNAGASQWTKGKGFDTFKPLGPALVTTHAIPDPQNLRITTRVNGAAMQDSTTNDMIFTCAEIIEWLSDNQTLRPGAVILTGTPSGIGAGRSPPHFLKVGDELECEISDIGVLRHRIAMPPPK